MKIREATLEDSFRLVEMASRFLITSRYGAMFDNKATPDTIGALIKTVLNFGAIFVAEVDALERVPGVCVDIDGETYLRHEEAGGCEVCRQTVLAGMLAIVVLPHPLTGLAFADEIAWWVEPEHRGGTIGPKMLRAAEDWATTNGANMVKMVAPAGSTVGTFYERMGYEAAETAYIKVL